MIGRPRRHRPLTDDVDPDQLSVFIPGAIASGFLISMALLVGDAVRRLTGTAGADRNVRVTSAGLAEEVRMGAGAARSLDRGLRPRPLYGIAGGVSLGIALGAIPGATWNFFNPSGYSKDIGWIWATSMVAIIFLVALGVQLMRLAPEWWPIFFIVTGASIVLRFLFGRESFELRVSVIAVATVASVLAAAATWRLRARKHTIDVPPSTRRLLALTPAGKLD